MLTLFLFLPSWFLQLEDLQHPCHGMIYAIVSGVFLMLRVSFLMNSFVAELLSFVLVNASNGSACQNACMYLGCSSLPPYLGESFSLNQGSSFTLVSKSSPICFFYKTSSSMLHFSSDPFQILLDLWGDGCGDPGYNYSLHCYTSLFKFEQGHKMRKKYTSVSQNIQHKCKQGTADNRPGGIYFLLQF